MSQNDVAAVSHLVAIEKGWTEDRRLATTRAYEAFLTQCARGEHPRPTLDVDALWHCHILHSTSYARYCAARFGRYIHHVACLPPAAAAELQRRLGPVLPDFLRAGTPDGLHADCGDADTPPEPDCLKRDVRLADCGDPVDTPPGPQEIRFADCGPPVQPPRPSPVPPALM